MRRPLGETPPHPQQEEGAVGILVAGGVFALSSFLPFLQTALEERLQRPAGGLDRGVLSAVLAAASGVIEVREIEAGHVLGTNPVKKRHEVGGVALGEGEAHPYLEAARHGAAHGPCAGGERPHVTAKTVVRGL